MELLRALLLYLAMIYLTAVETAPVSADIPSEPTAAPAETAMVTESPDEEMSQTSIDITPNPAYKTLRSGDKGDEVRALQQELAYYGYYTGNVDGRYGNQTRYAVERFQYAHGLTADGIAGKQTLTVLYESDSVLFASPTPTPFSANTPNIEVVATPAPTVTPALTVSPTVSPNPSPTPAVSQSEETVSEESCALLFDDSFDLSLDEETLSGITTLHRGDSTYLPLSTLLSGMGINVIAGETNALSEMAFVLSDKLICISFNRNEDGLPLSLSIDFDGEKTEISQPECLLNHDQLYFSLDTLETILSIKIEYEPGQKTIRFLPAVPS